MEGRCSMVSGCSMMVRCSMVGGCSMASVCSMVDLNKQKQTSMTHANSF